MMKNVNVMCNGLCRIGVLLGLVFGLLACGTKQEGRNRYSVQPAREEAQQQQQRQQEESPRELPGVVDYVLADDGKLSASSAPPPDSNAGEPGGGHRARAEADAAAFDEVWILEQPQVAPDQQPDARPALIAQDPESGKFIPVPLKHTEVKARIAGYIAEVLVQQQFHNPFEAKIEATYVFPLPQNAAVTDFVMVIGERRIRGLIRERKEAERLYQEARRQGYVASLLTQERPNIFTQKVANIEPGKQIDVEITYFNALKYEDGGYEFVFPMVVGPRYNPPGHEDGVGAVARGAQSVQDVFVSYLAPNERSGHDINLTVELEAGMKVERLESVNHQIEKQQEGDRISVQLATLDRVPNKDFVLRYQTAGQSLKQAMLVHRGEAQQTFALMLQPPVAAEQLPRVAREMIFVVDCSGSMSGAPMQKVKQAMRRCLRGLQAEDTFQIIRFSERASSLGRHPIAATPENVRKGLRYIDELRGMGGTQMIEGIKAALGMRSEDRERLRIVSFMTDGFIGNEREILEVVRERLGDTRIFSFGIGSSVNRYLIESLARTGRGAAAYVGLDEGSGAAVDAFYRRAARPALTDIEIDWGGMQVSDVYPARMPDLFVGRPVLLTGQFSGEPGVVRVKGRQGGREVEFEVAVAEAGDHAGIGFVWARTKIRHMAHGDYAPEDLVAFSISNRVLCGHTAFLAVDSSRQTEGDHGYSVAVPVPVPDGVRYDTTVER